MRLSQNVTIFYILYTCKENVELKKNVYMKQKLTCITHMTFDIRRFEAAPFFLETKHIRTIDNKLLINNFNFRWDICRYQYVFKYVLIKIFSPVFKFHNSFNFCMPAPLVVGKCSSLLFVPAEIFKLYDHIKFIIIYLIYHRNFF